MRAWSFVVVMFALFAESALAGGHYRRQRGLVGYGPVNPYGYTMTNELYTTSFAPTFREFIREPIVPLDEGPTTKPAPRRGSMPSPVLQPPATIPNPQLTPPPAGGGATTSTVPPPPTPASVKPSSGAAPPPSTSPRRP